MLYNVEHTSSDGITRTTLVTIKPSSPGMFVAMADKYGRSAPYYSHTLAIHALFTGRGILSIEYVPTPFVNSETAIAAERCAARAFNAARQFAEGTDRKCLNNAARILQEVRHFAGCIAEADKGSEEYEQAVDRLIRFCSNIKG